MTITRRSLLVLPAGLLGLSGCGETTPAAERTARARRASGDIVVGASWPLSTAKGTYGNGVELARDEINAAGGVLARPLRLVLRDDKLSVTRGIAIAHEFAGNLDMVAVLGTLNSYIAVATAPVYEDAGLVMLTQGSSVERLTAKGYRRVFRMIPSNRRVGELLAEHAAARKYRRVLVYYVKNEYGLDLANAFEQRAGAVGVEVADRVSYLAGAGDYRLAMQHWKDFYNFDAIFLAASLPDGATILEAIRQVGIRQPVFGADGLDSPDLARLAGPAAEGTEVISFFHPAAPLDHVQAFKARYEQRFRQLPDSSAALGYDGVMLLADAIRRAGSTVPDAIAKALRATRGWRGVSGMHNFDEHGNVPDKEIVIQAVRDGRFAYVLTSGAKGGAGEPGR